ncbi:MAG: hypothetical protein R3B84_02850 [Zavarzinella sp.]
MSAKLIAFYKAYRLTIAYALMAIVLAAPYIDIIYPSIGLREKLLSAIPLFLLFLFNDWRTEMDDRLKRVEQGLHKPHPPTFRRFPAMEEDMQNVLSKLIGEGNKITIKIMAVSSKFSGPFIQRAISDLLENNRKVDVEVDIVLTTPNKLGELQLDDWQRSSTHSIQEICVFMAKHKQKMSEIGIFMKLAEYDNLPHWHGVLFNDRILFMGRTEWFSDGDDGRWQLRVGEVEYRRFEKDDSYGGKERIDRFVLWFQRYFDRAKHNSAVHTTDADNGRESATNES